MIVEQGAHKYRDVVTRICDDCGNKKRKTFGSVMDARKRRSSKSDYCKKCSYAHRRLEQPTMEFSPSWKGGRYQTEKGYYRVYCGNGFYQYEHKQIMSKHVGRDLTPKEKVHHLDLDKANNVISNLFLFANKHDHAIAHHSLEEAAFSLFGLKIWYDGKKAYSRHFCQSHKNIAVDVSDLMNLRTFLTCRKKGCGHREYVALTNRKEANKFGSGLLHVLIAERIIGRDLKKNEVVHHIDGNSLNNDPDNLVVMTRGEHTACHYSVQRCGAELYSCGDIAFTEGRYYVS